MQLRCNHRRANSKTSRASTRSVLKPGVEIDFLKDPQADETKAVEDAVNYLKKLIAET